MIIHFGLHLDGMQAAPAATAVGEITAGPARFLDLLELELGLPPTLTRPGEALLAYQSCLTELDAESRFYHRSFAVDEIGVARTLLEWRARWYESGWRGSFERPVSRRLADMADVERLAGDRVPMTPGQRLKRVEQALAQGLVTQVERIVLHDEAAVFPAAWSAVLRYFHCATAAGVAPAANAAPGTDLHRAQEALLALVERAGDVALEPIALAADRSLIVVRGVSRDLTAQALGEYLLKTNAPQDTVVIAEHDGIIVDNALERVGLPRAGFQHHSRFRAMTQVLKLALGLVWKPVSVKLLLQFLLHPVGPLPTAARSMLAEAVAGEPGIGGHAWREALDKIAAFADRPSAPHGDAAAEAPPHAATAAPAHAATAGSADAERLLADIRYWLECERFAPSEGAPIAVLIERAQRCTSWLARRLHGVAHGEADLYAAAEAQGEALIAALASLAERGDTHVRRIQLEQLVDEVTGHSIDPDTFAQPGHVAATTEPATITQAWRTVVWWDLTAPAAHVGHPWSDAEIEELGAQGVVLPPADERIRARSRAWLRPILNARSQLILVVHDRDEGHHPLWSQLRSIARNFNEIRIEDELLGGHDRPAIPALEVATVPLALKPLPGPRRWWQLPPDCVPGRRDAESYSSLQKLIYYPHEWVLRYRARLASGRAANVASGPLLYGNLAHRLFESYFAALPEWAAHDEAHVRGWLAATLPRIIEQEGAVLAELGMGVRREQVTATLENALLALLAHLRQAGIVRVEAEQWHEVPFVNVAGGGSSTVALRGAIDLLLTDRHGRETVLDVKWGGQDWRGLELAENRALQLATYAYMRHRAGTSGSWPEHAYFIVTTGNVVARDLTVFPTAVPFAPAEPASTASIWARLCNTYDWRSAQLAAGCIEVNAPGTAPDARSTPPDDGLAAAVEPDRFDDYGRLTGWERGE